MRLRNKGDRQPNELMFRCKILKADKTLQDVGMAFFSRHRNSDGIWEGELWDLVTLDPETDERVILAPNIYDEDIPRLPWNYMISPAIVRKRKDGGMDIAMNIRRNLRFDRVTVGPVQD